MKPTLFIRNNAMVKRRAVLISLSDKLVLHRSTHRAKNQAGGLYPFIYGTGDQHVVCPFGISVAVYYIPGNNKWQIDQL